jgi:hypothetical protein
LTEADRRMYAAKVREKSDAASARGFDLEPQAAGSW